MLKSLGRGTYRIAKAPSDHGDSAQGDYAHGDSDGTACIPLVKIPIRCPHCDTEHLCDYPEPVVVMALTRWNNMNLHVPCHDVYWCASQGELRAIRQHLGEAWIKSRTPICMPNPQRRVFA